MFDKYPTNIQTMIDAEYIAEKHSPLINDIITEFYNDRLYVIHGNLSIKSCLVFQNDKIVDCYSTALYDEIYQNKSFKEWILDFLNQRT